MSRDIKKINPALLLIAVLSVGLQDVASGAVSPAIADMIAAFPQYSPAVVQTMSTLPQLSMCIVAPLYGWLSTKFQPRRLLIFGLICFIFGGAFPVFLNSMPLIMVCRLILGVGTGITMPGALAIIPVFYSGRQRDKLIGWNQAVGAIGGIVLQYLGGRLCIINWHYTFLAYLFGCIAFAMCLFVLPDIPMEKVATTADFTKKVSIWKRIPTRIYILVIFIIISSIFATMPTTNIAIFIEAQGLGNAAVTGTVMGFYVVGIFIGSVFFGPISKKLRAYAIPIALVFAGGGWLLSAFSKSLVELIIILIFAGMGTGCSLCAYIGRASEVVDLQWVAFSIGLISAAQAIGAVIHPWVIEWVSKAFNIGVGKPAIVFAGCVMLGFAVLTAIVYTILVTTKNYDMGKVNEDIQDLL